RTDARTGTRTPAPLTPPAECPSV
ncbi:MAG: hypothetical protein JWP54_3292, partial [Cryobacterium sp.]|nr:hypothetical protein [Cryobacterium sp.]